MTMDLGKFRNPEPFASVKTSIGELCLFRITVGGQIELSKELAKPIKECEPIYYAKKLFRHVCFLNTSLRDGKYKPEKPLLSDSDIENLSSDDIESIAKVYVENNDSLTKKLIKETTKGKDGGSVIKFSYGDIMYQRLEGETYTQYLLRLTIKEEEKQAKQFGDVISRMTGGFSNTLGDNIRNTLARGDSLKKIMDSIRPSDYLLPRIQEPMLPNVDWGEIQRGIDERRLKPFNELSGRMDKLIDVTTETTKFLIEANKIQTEIAGEIKRTGDDAKRWARINTIIGIVVIAFTIIGTCVSAYFYSNSKKDSNEQSTKIKEYVNILDNRLIEINKSITSPNNNIFKEQLNKNKRVRDSVKRNK